MIAHQNAIGFGVCLFLWSWMFGASIFYRRHFINWFITDLILWGALRWAEIPDLISTAWLVGVVCLRASKFKKWRRQRKLNPFIDTVRFFLEREYVRVPGSSQVSTSMRGIDGNEFTSAFFDLRIEFGLKCAFVTAIVFVLCLCGWTHWNVVSNPNPIMWFYWGCVTLFLAQTFAFFRDGWSILMGLSKAGESNSTETRLGKLVAVMAKTGGFYEPGTFYPFLSVVACCHLSDAAFGIAGFSFFFRHSDP